MNTNNLNDYRLEKDSIGVKKIPKGAYYGINAVRAAENFNITGLRLHKDFIISLAQIKKAAAIANFNARLLECKIKDAIVQACDEIIEGKFHDQFIVDPVQGGAGTSTNMNANEVKQSADDQRGDERDKKTAASVQNIVRPEAIIANALVDRLRNPETRQNKKCHDGFMTNASDEIHRLHEYRHAGDLRIGKPDHASEMFDDDNEGDDGRPISNHS